MEEIRNFVDEMITWAGVTGDFVPMLRHILLTITAILLAMLSDFLCRKILVPLISKITDKTDITWDDVLLNKKVLTSACHIVPAVVIWSLMPLIYLEYPIFKEILERATGIYIVVMSVRTALVFIGSFKGLEDSQERRSSAQQYFHTFCGVLRILMLFVAAVVVVAILLDKNPMTLFAGLGATSAVLMLVFKDTISGLVAGVRLTSNDMLHKGDWITVKSVDANGIVEDISLTTVKVRNFDNTIVTISPINLVNGSFQNWIGMQKSGGRRVKRVVYFDFRSVRLVDETLKRNLLARHFATEDSFKLKESLQKAIDKDIQEGKDIEDLKNPAALAPTNLQLYRKFMEKYLRQRLEVNTDLTLMVRQDQPQEIADGRKVCLSLADFVPSEKKGPMGVFAVSVLTSHGPTCTCGCHPIGYRHPSMPSGNLTESPNNDKDYNGMMDRAVRVTLAEAASQWLDEHLKALIRTKPADRQMKVVKPAAGYASCPDHTLKKDILALLPDGAKLGIELTESYAMIPDASICGFVFFHPEATYPGIRHISKEQFDDYVARRGMSEKNARQFLGYLL